MPAALCRGFVYWLQAGQPVFQKYLYLAQHLTEMGHRPFYSSPLYTFWIHLLTHHLGLSVNHIRGVQLLSGVFTVALITHTVWMLADRKSAVLSGLMFGLTGPVIIYESDLVTASLVISIQALSLWLLIRGCFSKPDSSLFWIGSGLTYGLAIGIRPNMILGLPVIAILFCLQQIQPSRRVQQMVMFVICACLMVGPITLINWHRTGELIPVTASGGSVFYSSNNYRASGLGYSPPPALSQLESQWMKTNNVDRPVEHDIFRYLASRAAGRKLSHRETSRYYMVDGWKQLWGDPVDSAIFWLKKLFYTVNNYEVLDTASLIATSRRVVSRLPFLFPGAVLIVLGIIGIRTVHRTFLPGWFVLAFALPHLTTGVMFYVNGRLRAPLFYFFAVFAGSGLIHVFDLIRRRHASVWMTIFFLMGLAAVTGYKNEEIMRHEKVESPAFYASVRALSEYKAGNVSGAEDLFLSAVDVNPLSAVEAWQYLADIYTRRGARKQAELCSRRASGSWSHAELDNLVRNRLLSEYEISMCRARTDWQSGNRTAAMMEFTRATIDYPGYPEPWFNRAMILSMSGSNWQEVIDCSVRALDRGMKYSLESGRAHQLILVGFDSLNNTSAGEFVRKQIAWEEQQIFNPG